MSKPVTLSPTELQSAINSEKRPLLLVFSATWCAPCKASAPYVAAFAQGHPEVLVVKVDVDEHPSVAQRFMLRSVPTFILLQDGAVLGVKQGAANLTKLTELLQSAIGVQTASRG